MKKTWVILASVVALAVGIYVASQGWAQQQQPYTAAASASAPRTHIALLNLMAVIRNYDKYKNGTANLKREIEGAQQALKSKQAALLEKRGQAQSPTLTTAQKEQLIHDMKALERDYQDAADDFKQRVETENMNLLVQVYREVEDATKRYAANYDFDLVLHYSDAPPEEANNQSSIVRRAGNNACVPLYIAPGLDITNAITSILNQNLSAGSAPASNGQAVPATH